MEAEENKEKEMEKNSTEEKQDVEVSAEEETKDEVSELTEKLSEMEDKYLRAQAEIANMRNRFQKEREGLAKYGSQDLAKAMLPAIDNLERALAAETVDQEEAGLKKGVEMVLESLQHALKENGIVEIETENQTFDPTLHQAVQTVPVEEGQEAEQIIQVLQKGYQLQDRVLRPSMVIVAQ